MEIVKGQAAVFRSFIIIGHVPFPRGPVCVRQHVDAAQQSPEEVSSCAKAAVDAVDNLRIGQLKALEPKAHCNHGMNMRRIGCRIWAVPLKMLGGIQQKPKRRARTAGKKRHSMFLPWRF